MRRLLRVALVAAAVCSVAAFIAFQLRYEIIRRQSALPPFTHDAGDVHTVMVPMRDGVALHTRVALPATSSSPSTTAWPTILVRNPYTIMTPLVHLGCGLLNRYGYACVLQDVRGQGKSEGRWEPLVRERDDGIDTLRWLVDADFVDGNIATMGPSYLGAVQWAVADVVPPEVKTMVPMVMGTDLHGAMYERGLFRHEVMTAWAALMPVPGMRLFAGGSAYERALAHRPHADADVAAFGVELPWYREWIASPSLDDAYWQRDDVQALARVPENVERPMLVIGGFFDPFFDAQRRAFDRLQTRADSVMILTPTNHLGEVSGDYPIGVDDDERALAGQYPWPLLLDWFDHHLRGQPLKILRPGEVWVLSPTARRFRRTSQWPEPTTTTTLTPRANATLTATTPPPTTTTTLAWTSDPSAPQAARGGASLLAFAFFPFQGIEPGPLRLDAGDARPDGLTFRSPPLAQTTTLRGAMALDVVVSSSASDGAVVARVSVEDDDGAFLIREAAATLRFPRDEHRQPAPPPGTSILMHLDFWPIEWTLQPGQRLRLDISSSSAPALHTHNNRDEPWAGAVGADVAELKLVVDDPRTALSVPLDPAPWP